MQNCLKVHGIHTRLPVCLYHHADNWCTRYCVRSVEWWSTVLFDQEELMVDPVCTGDVMKVMPRISYRKLTDLEAEVLLCGQALLKIFERHLFTFLETLTQYNTFFKNTSYRFSATMVCVSPSWTPLEYSGLLCMSKTYCPPNSKGSIERMAEHPPRNSRNLIAAMGCRCHAVITDHGGHTCYWLANPTVVNFMWCGHLHLCPRYLHNKNLLILSLL